MLLLHLILLSFINGFFASTCNFDVRLEQGLINQGFHRKITYAVKFTDKYGDRQLYENCSLGLEQNLPPGVYAYPAELSDLWRLKQLTAIPKDRVNVELPAEQSQPTSVFIIGQVEYGRADLWLPVHARYHHASKAGGFIVNRIEPPHVVLRCPHLKQLHKCEPHTSLIKNRCGGGGDEMCIWKQIPVTVVTKPITFAVPIGNLDHMDIVTPTTIGAVIICSLYLLKTLHHHKMAMGKRLK